MHDSDSAYTRTAIGLHWIIFVTIAAGWALGQYMTGLPFSPQKLRYVAWHKWIGVTAFLLTALRLGWRAFHAPPPLPASMTAFEQRAAASMHALLYVLVFVIPLSGWLFSSALGVPTVYLGLVQLPDLLQKDKALAQTLRQVHATLNWTLLAAISLHALAALKHQFIDRDTVLARMLPHLNRCR